METVDVVQMTIPGFRHHRQRPPITRGIGTAGVHTLRDHRIADDADTVRIGQHDRAFKLAGFVDPGSAGHFAIAVQGKPAGEDRCIRTVLAARQDRGHPGAHLVRVREILDQGHLANRDPGNIGERVERSGCALKRNAEIARARFGR